MLLFAAAVALICSAGCESRGNADLGAKQPDTPAAAQPQANAADTLPLITQEEIPNKKQTPSPSYNRFFGMSQEGPIIPALMQDYVPQGMTYLKSEDWLLISYYSLKKEPSLITVVDRSSGKLVKSFFLYNQNKTAYTGHAGGLAASGKYVWISNDKKVYTLRISDIVDGKDRSRLTFDGVYSVETNGSFVTFADDVLWVGEFARSDYPTKDAHKMKARDEAQYSAWVAGYKLDQTTGLIATAQKMKDGALVPDYILAIPNEIQGMDIGGDRIYLSRSYGRNNASNLFVYQNPLKEQPHALVQSLGNAPVPLWFLDGKNRTDNIFMPPTAEGIVSVNDVLYILYESGSSEMRGNGAYPVDRLRMLDLRALGGA